MRPQSCARLLACARAAWEASRGACAYALCHRLLMPRGSPPPTQRVSVLLRSIHTHTHTHTHTCAHQRGGKVEHFVAFHRRLVRGRPARNHRRRLQGQVHRRRWQEGRMHVCVCVCVCLSTCMHVCVCVNIYTYAYEYTQVKLTIWDTACMCVYVLYIHTCI